MRIQISFILILLSGWYAVFSGWPEKRLNTARLIKMRMEGQIVAKGKGMVNDQIYYVMPKE